jgi:GNAT superfamily N-acetyltransferase
MNFSARLTNPESIARWRDMYRTEMACQIVHDSIHDRPGWTDEYMLFAGDTGVGYGSVAVGGPWSGAPAVYNFYVLPEHRVEVFDLFRAFLVASGAASMVVQSNDVLATAMLHTFAEPVTSESILFHDKVRTSRQPPGATFRAPTEEEVSDVPDHQLKWHGVVEVDGQIAARGGILFHYNRPYGDIYMETHEPFRRRGFGSFLVQELKRVCYEGGHLPAARCSPHNVASRRTLQSAGFVPCGHILSGLVSEHRER